jgi:hypothetical protein
VVRSRDPETLKHVTAAVEAMLINVRTRLATP